MTQNDFNLPEDPNETIELIAQRLSEFRDEPSYARFEWIVDVAETLTREGLGTIAKQLLEICRLRFLPQLPESDQLPARAHVNRVEGLQANREGRFREAVALLGLAVEQYGRIGDPLSEAISHQNLSATYLQQGRMSEARTESLRALQMFKELAFPLRQAQVLVNLANVDLDTGDLRAARKQLDEADELAGGRDGRSIRTSILGTRAHLARLEGNVTEAGALYRQIVNRLRRGAFVDQARLAAQNLGSWYADSHRPKLAALWLGRAATLAWEEGNPRLTAQLMRSQALQLLFVNRVEDARSTMRMAIAVSADLHDEDGVAEGRADLAAILMTPLTQVHNDEEADLAVLNEADELLELALARFRASGDLAWSHRVEDNAISLALLRGEPFTAIQRVYVAREGTDPEEGGRRLELDRRGAAISAADVKRPQLAGAFIREAAQEARSGAGKSRARLPGSDLGAHLGGNGAAAWELTVGAAQLRFFTFALPTSIELFREAQQLAEEDQTLYFHITNDLGTAFAEQGDESSAIECFDTCLGIAARFNDRVLRQQALANRGEMSRRLGEPDATSQLQEAVQLARNLGDIRAAVAAQLNLGLAYLDRGSLTRAESIAKRAANTVAQNVFGDEARGGVESLLGAIAAARGDFVAAYGHYSNAHELLEGTDRLDVAISVLLVLADDGDSRRYRRWLQRTITQAQAEQLDGYLAEHLTKPADRWLQTRSRNIGADTYSAAIVLALNQVGRDLPVLSHREAGESSDEATILAERLDPFYKVIMRLAASLENGGKGRASVLPRIKATLRKTIGEPSDEMVIAWIDQAIATGRSVFADLRLWEDNGAV